MSAEHLKNAADVISISSVVASILGYLPAIAALLSIVWSIIRIYETDTVQRWLYGARKE